MKNLFNKIFGISRCTVKVEDGIVTDLEIISYDLVIEPGSGFAFSEINDMHKQIQKELDRQELLKTRREKLNKLNSLN